MLKLTFVNYHRTIYSTEMQFELFLKTSLITSVISEALLVGWLGFPAITTLNHFCCVLVAFLQWIKIHVLRKVCLFYVYHFKEMFVMYVEKMGPAQRVPDNQLVMCEFCKVTVRACSPQEAWG